MKTCPNLNIQITSLAKGVGRTTARGTKASHKRNTTKSGAVPKSRDAPDGCVCRKRHFVGGKGSISASRYV